MEIPNCKECKYYLDCAVRKLNLPIEYCQYEEKENE